jgi:hypothetical protein
VGAAAAVSCSSAAEAIISVGWGFSTAKKYK